MATMTEEKLRELMLKVHKGATASLTWAQYKAVIEALGGTMEPTLAAVPIGHPRNGRVDLAGISVLAAKRETMLSRIEQFKTAPKKIKPGTLHITHAAEDARAKSDSYSYVEFDGFVGANGWRVTLNGASLDAMPGYSEIHDAAKRTLETGEPYKPRMFPYDLMRWLDTNGWKAMASAYLGIEEHVPGAQRTKENTGTCPVCFRNIKLEGGRMVLHGYRRPGDGVTHGECYGVRFEPYELAATGSEKWLELVLKPTLQRHTDSLRFLKSGKAKELRRHGGEIVRHGDPDFERTLAIAIESTASSVASAKSEVATFTWLVDHWKLESLPVPGTFEKQYYTLARRAALGRAG